MNEPDRVYGRNPVLALLRGGGRRVDEIAVLAGRAARSPRSWPWRGAAA